jgi:hypothetical protein
MLEVLLLLLPAAQQAVAQHLCPVAEVPRVAARAWRRHLGC